MTKLKIQGGNAYPKNPYEISLATVMSEEWEEWQAEHPEARAFYEDGTPAEDGDAEGTLQWKVYYINKWRFLNHYVDGAVQVWLIPKQPGAVKEETVEQIAEIKQQAIKHAYSLYPNPTGNGTLQLWHIAHDSFLAGHTYARQQENGWVPEQKIKDVIQALVKESEKNEALFPKYSQESDFYAGKRQTYLTVLSKLNISATYLFNP